MDVATLSPYPFPPLPPPPSLPPPPRHPPTPPPPPEHCRSAHLSVCPSVRLSIRPSARPPARLLARSMPACPSAFPPARLPVRLPACPLSRFPACPPACPTANLSACLPAYCWAMQCFSTFIVWHDSCTSRRAENKCMKACTFTSSAPEHCIEKISVHNIELLHSYLTDWGLVCVLYCKCKINIYMYLSTYTMNCN